MRLQKKLPGFVLCLWVAISLLWQAGLMADVAVPQGADGRLAVLRIELAPERAGWTYAVGEPAYFSLRLLADDQPVDGVEVRYSVGPEMLPAETLTATVGEKGLRIDGGTLQEPGFIRCSVTVEWQGNRYRKVSTAGFDPESIRATQSMPEDFEEFWQAGLDELAKIPLEAVMTLMPEAGTDKVDVYHVRFRNAGPRPGTVSSIYGIYCEPKAAGKYPALLSVPGAGVRPYGGVKDLAAEGMITLQIGIHGIPVNLPQELYDSLREAALNSYNVHQLDNRDQYYYRRVYLGCVRSNDFLTSRDKWDGENLIVTGGSQGGQLSIITASLDKRVTGLAAIYPAYSDVTGYLHGRAGGWPHMMRAPAEGGSSPHAVEDKIAVTGYFDTVNFGRRLQVPGFFTWGYNDEVCPPTSMFAFYNENPAPKELWLALETGHNTLPEQWKALNGWILRRAGVK